MTEYKFTTIRDKKSNIILRNENHFLLKLFAVKKYDSFRYVVYHKNYNDSIYIRSLKIIAQYILDDTLNYYINKNNYTETIKMYRYKYKKGEKNFALYKQFNETDFLTKNKYIDEIGKFVSGII